MMDPLRCEETGRMREIVQSLGIVPEANGGAVGAQSSHLLCPSEFNYLPFVVSIGILVTFLLGASLASVCGIGRESSHVSRRLLKGYCCLGYQV